MRSRTLALPLLYPVAVVEPNMGAIVNPAVIAAAQ